MRRDCQDLHSHKKGLALSTISGLLQILQFGDSVLPVGSFSFSNGLESAIQQGIVFDLDSLRQFVDVAAEQSARCDGIAVLHAHRAATEANLAEVIRADWAVHNRKLNEEMRIMTVRMGQKLAELATHVVSAPLIEHWLADIRLGKTPGTYPVAQALIFAHLALSEKEAFASHQYGLVSMMLGAALRLMKLHYRDSQAILFEINSRAELLYEHVATASLDDMAVFAPLMDILAAVHVQAHVRMFMN